MDLQLLLGLTRKAIDEYKLIDEGDKIAVGLSGGKDSLTLLYALKALQSFYPKHFDLMAITVDLGYDGTNFAPLRAFCESLDVSFLLVDTNIAHVVFDERKEKNPCSLCATLRKGALNRNAVAAGCNKIAYAHHKDDIIETMLMALVFEGRLHSFSPRTELTRTGLTVIRPLMFADEKEVISFTRRYQLPVVKNMCPVDGFTKREWAKTLLKQLEDDCPTVRQNIFTAILNGQLDGWPQRFKRSM